MDQRNEPLSSGRSTISPILKQKKKAKRIFSNLLVHRGVYHRNFRSMEESNSLQDRSLSDDNTTSRLRNENGGNIKNIPLTDSQKMSQKLRQEIEENNVIEFEDGRLTHFLFHKKTVVDLACSFFYVAGLILAIIAYDVGFIENGGYTTSTISLTRSESNVIKIILLGLVQGTTMLLCKIIMVKFYIKINWKVPMIIIRYHLRLKYYKARGEAPINSTIFHSPHALPMYIEILVASIHPSPLLIDFKFDNMNTVTGYNTYYEYNDILSLLMLIRALAILRIMITNSHYYGNSAKRICTIYGCNNNYAYVFKCLMYKCPLQMIVGTMLTVIFLFGYALKICERSAHWLMPLKKTTQQAGVLKPIFLTIIMQFGMVVTMATVGYGDFVPRTMPGRMLGFFICIYGVVGVSLMVLTLQNILTLNFRENRAMLQSERVQFLNMQKLYAGKVVKMVARFSYMKNHADLFTDSAVTGVIKQIKYNLNRFKAAQRDLELHQNKLSFEEELNRQFFFLKNEFNGIQEKVAVLAELQNLLYENLDENPPIKVQTKSPDFDEVQKSIQQMKKIIENPDNSNIDSIDSIESFTDMKDVIQNSSNKSKTPLLSLLMREKRLSDYKINTAKFKTPMNKINKDIESFNKNNIKSFINARKSINMS